MRKKDVKELCRAFICATRELEKFGAMPSNLRGKEMKKYLRLLDRQNKAEQIMVREIDYQRRARADEYLEACRQKYTTRPVEVR